MCYHEKWKKMSEKKDGCSPVVDCILGQLANAGAAVTGGGHECQGSVLVGLSGVVVLKRRLTADMDVETMSAVAARHVQAGDKLRKKVLTAGSEVNDCVKARLPSHRENKIRRVHKTKRLTKIWREMGGKRRLSTWRDHEAFRRNRKISQTPRSALKIELGTLDQISSFFSHGFFSVLCWVTVVCYSLLIWPIFAVRYF